MRSSLEELNFWQRIGIAITVLFIGVVVLLLVGYLWAAGLQLIFVHGPAGQEIDVNITEISTILRPRKDVEGHFAAGTECLLTMNNGKQVATTETCQEIVKMIAGLEKK
jgi:hypothetical protein